MIANDIELERLKIQHSLDVAKKQVERNKLGQFATPTALATDILEYTRQLLSQNTALRFLDPAIGTGSFFSALLHSILCEQVVKAVGYEIDPLYSHRTAELWRNTLLDVRNADFTSTIPPITEDAKYNLLVCNPPYVRHHHLQKIEKQRLQDVGKQATGIKLNGQAGLYCHFLTIAHSWMAENALAVWLIPSEFMDADYGRQVKEYLLNKVTLLRIHRFNPNDLQFNDALVSSAVVCFMNRKNDMPREVDFSYGGTLNKPEKFCVVSRDVLANTNKWTIFPLATNSRYVRDENELAVERDNRLVSHLEMPEFVLSTVKGEQDKGFMGLRKGSTLADLFTIKRGLATGANDFFVLDEENIERYQIPERFLVPILPPSRYLRTDEVHADEEGNPLLKPRLFLLNCFLKEDEIQSTYPLVWEYLKKGIERGIDLRYLCSHRPLWYMQETRQPALFLCSYIGHRDGKSNRPFRFIVNHSKAIATNAYHMLYPKPNLQILLQENPQAINKVWNALNAISVEVLVGEGRVYGGGMHKLEPKELGNVPVESIITMIEDIKIQG